MTPLMTQFHFDPAPRAVRTRTLAALAAALCATALAAPAAAQSGRSNAGPVQTFACGELAGRNIAGAAILSSQVVAATATVTEHCRVRGLIDPKLNFELRLPSLAAWNGKLHYGGGGGYNGSIPGVNANALNKGFAQVSSDSGHQGSALDASFVLGDPQAAALFGNLSVPVVMGVAKTIVHQYYHHPIRRAYFEGCSNGGREALIQVQRHPWLFEGVIARAPAYNWAGVMGAFNRTAKALAAPGGAMSAAKVNTLAGAVLAACDADDGVADGLVSNPAACDFNPAALRCPGGSDTGNACLSDAQLATVASWTDPAVFGGARWRNAGWPLSGNENVPGAWDTWVSAGPRLQFLFSDTTIKYYLAQDPAANSLTYVYDSDLAALAEMSALNDATDAAIQPFIGMGNKLMMWHGTNDAALSYRTTTEYFDRVVAHVGGRANADQFLRYYLAPGVNHCSGGPGADGTDLLAALDDWVSNGKAPGTLRAARVAGGAEVISRPLCVYPEYARYNVSGDVSKATSFTCVAP